MEIAHIPVMLEEVMEALKVKKNGIYLDGTVGLGGHAQGILEKTGGECTIIGIDQDSEAIELAGERLNGSNVHLVRDDFLHMESVVRNLGYKEVDGIFLDLGVSTLQLKAGGRGFSFLKDEPLDMRMDQGQRLTAADIVNKYPEKDLAHVLWQYGEERFSRKIARAIIDAREIRPVTTCMELSQLIEKTVRRGGRHLSLSVRIHPATRTFQALRIEVNKELTKLSMALHEGVNILGAGGRFCVLSYHSLEDRIVKHSFRDMAQRGVVSIITRKPLVPAKEEKELNPSSRSAKLRVAEKI